MTAIASIVKRTKWSRSHPGPTREVRLVPAILCNVAHDELHGKLGATVSSVQTQDFHKLSSTGIGERKFKLKKMLVAVHIFASVFPR